jgi:hypothetical protein
VIVVREPRGVGEAALTGPVSERTTVVSLRGRGGNLAGLPERTGYVGGPVHRGGWHLAGSALANPWRIGRDGDAGAVLARYEAHLLERPDLLELCWLLRGWAVACWCGTGPCHARVIARIADCPVSFDLVCCHSSDLGRPD